MKLPSIRKGERGIAIGSSGSGKTELIIRVLPRSGDLLVIDPKRELELPHLNLTVVTDPNKLRNHRRVLYQPNEQYLNDLDAYDQVIKTFYLRGNCCIYVDDMVGIMDRNKFPNYLRIAYMLGRAKGVTCISSVQRPANVPGFILSESQHYFVFRLVMPQDHKKMRDTLFDYDPDLINAYPYSFQYSDMRFSKKSELMKIALKK
jgi:hypothetical protein